MLSVSCSQFRTLKLAMGGVRGCIVDNGLARPTTALALSRDPEDLVADANPMRDTNFHCVDGNTPTQTHPPDRSILENTSKCGAFAR